MMFISLLIKRRDNLFGVDGLSEGHTDLLDCLGDLQANGCFTYGTGNDPTSAFSEMARSAWLGSMDYDDYCYDIFDLSNTDTKDKVSEYLKRSGFSLDLIERSFRQSKPSLTVQLRQLQNQVEASTKAAAFREDRLRKLHGSD